MRGLILKDILTIRQYLRSSILILAIWAIIFLFDGQAYIWLGAMGVFVAMQLISSIAVDQQVKWESYALTLPLSRRDLVRAKYIAGLILMAAAAVLILLLGAFSILSMGAGWLEIILLIASGLFAAVLGLAVAIPLLYRFGAEKGRIIMLGAFLVCFILLYSLFNVSDMEQIGLWLDSASPFALVLGYVLLAAAVYYASYRISLAVFRKKEF